MRNFNRNNGARGRRGDFNKRDENRERPEMHKVVCDKCGKNCEVPFKPSSDKPIFCDDCFREKNRSKSNRSDNRSGNRNFLRSGSREREYFKAICAECGNVCEVPFRPSGDKPVLCSVCFDKQGESKDRGNSLNNNPQFQEQFKMINEKLDKILKNFLTPVNTKSIDTEKKIAAKPSTKKKVVGAKKAKKKTTKK